MKSTFCIEAGNLEEYCNSNFCNQCCRQVKDENKMNCKLNCDASAKPENDDHGFQVCMNKQ